MKSEEIRELLKQAEYELTTLSAYWKKQQKDAQREKLKAISTQEDFWQHPDQITIMQQLQQLEEESALYHSALKDQKDFAQLLSLYQEDEEGLHSLYIEVKQLLKSLSCLKLHLLLEGKNDSRDCFLSVNAGAGGTESQDWAEMLLRMYTRFCERQKWNTSLLDYQKGEGAGIKSATLAIKGSYAYGLLKVEEGVHRLVRISPFDANKRRHTSFASISVSPEVPLESISIEEKDLRIDTYRAGGAGGQHVNKTESAVRITHLPTGIVVQCQNERSQAQNKQTAFKMLAAKLEQKQEAERKAKESLVNKQKIEWGSQIRSYVLHPYRLVKDARTHHESSQTEAVLDGDLLSFIENALITLG